MDQGPFREGARVNQYQVQRFLEEGALGPIYQAIDTSAQRSVELRVVSPPQPPPGPWGSGTPQPAWTPVTMTRVNRAAERLVRLRHPNILTVLHFGGVEGNFFLVTDDVRAATLADRFETDPPHPEAARHILESVAEALDFVHSEGLLHGCLGASSVLLGGDGRPYLADIGIAPQLDPEPERFTAEEDRRALAALAYETLTGQRPARGRYRPVSALNPDAGRDTDAVFNRALALGPGTGYPTATEFVDALYASLGRKLSPVPPTNPKPNRTPWIVGGAIAVVVVALIALLAWYLIRQASQPSLALSTSSGQAGMSVVVTGRHLPPDQLGTIQIHSQAEQIGTFQADAHGNVNQTVTIPNGLTPGDHLISLCWSGSCPANAQINIGQPTPSPSPSPTPTPTPTPTIIPTPTPTPVPTPIPTREPTPPPPTPTPTPSTSTRSGG
jgi:serine/threonine protein kinase